MITVWPYRSARLPDPHMVRLLITSEPFDADLLLIRLMDATSASLVAAAAPLSYAVARNGVIALTRDVIPTYTCLDCLAFKAGKLAARVNRPLPAPLPDNFTVQVDLIDNFRPDAGPGYLGGSFPSGITTVDGAPVTATVRVHYRGDAGAPGDGVLVAETESAVDGTWQVDNLDPNLKFDIIGRRAGFNDVIVANVSPTPYDSISIEGDLGLGTEGG